MAIKDIYRVKLFTFADLAITARAMVMFPENRKWHNAYMYLVFFSSSQVLHIETTVLGITKF